MREPGWQGKEGGGKLRAPSTSCRGWILSSSQLGTIAKIKFPFTAFPLALSLIDCDCCPASASVASALWRSHTVLLRPKFPSNHLPGVLTHTFVMEEAFHYWFQFFLIQYCSCLDIQGGPPPKKLELIYKTLCIYSYMFKVQSPSKHSPFDATHLSRCFFHCSEQFLSLSILMSFSASAVFCFISSTSAKRFPLRTDFFHWGNKKEVAQSKTR